MCWFSEYKNALTTNPQQPIYAVASFKCVIRSFLSFAFLSPPNAIFVPGMYFFGFSRYWNYNIVSHCHRPCMLHEEPLSSSYTPVCPLSTQHPPSCWHPYSCKLSESAHSTRDVHLDVRETLYLSGVATEESVKVGADLVTGIRLEVVTLCASCLEQVGALLGITWDGESQPRFNGL